MTNNNKEMKYLERLEIIVNENNFPLAEALIGQALVYGWEEESLATGETKLIMHCEKEHHNTDPILDRLAKEICDYLPDTKAMRSQIVQSDWTNAWKEYFTPIFVGDFCIVPPWLADNTTENDLENSNSSVTNMTVANTSLAELYNKYQNTANCNNASLQHIPQHKIVIEPKSAFGTGHHASTVLCLKAISTLYGEEKIKKDQTFLDLGTGTGILGIACVKYGLSGYGLDIESLAVLNANENKELNTINATQFPVELGSIDKAKGKKYDIVIANILAAPLREMAEEIVHCVKNNGCLILSGFLGTQVDTLENVYQEFAEKKLGKARRLTQETDMKDGEWVALFWG